MTKYFGFIPVASELLSEKEYESLAQSWGDILGDCGGKLISSETLDHEGPLGFLVLTGGTENDILNIHRQRCTHFPDEPLLLFTHPGNNSLPSALETLARVKQDGKTGVILPLDTSSQSDLKNLINDFSIQAELQNTRIGLIGQPSDWLVASSPDPKLASKVWGPEIVSIDIKEMIDTFDSISEAEAEEWVSELKNDSKTVVEPTNSEINAAARILLSIQQLIKKYQFDAVSLRCFDLVIDRKTTGCFALSLLNDLGIIAGCEGDLVSTLGMIWAKLISDQTPWMANPAQIDASGNRLLLAHCTIARNLITGYSLRSHFESNLGVGIQGDISVGPATLLRIGGSNLDQIWLAEGDVVATTTRDNLCRTQAEIKLSDKYDINDLLTNPLGNHIILIKGHYTSRMANWRQRFINH